MDLGTGDGRFVLRSAAADRDALFIGVDANAAGMRVASARAAAPPRRGGLPNAIFIASAVESLSSEMDEIADLVTVHYPWGSLLRGIVMAESLTLASTARIAKPGAEVRMLVSLEARDDGSGLHMPDGELSRVAARVDRFEAHGLRLAELRPAERDEISTAHSTWSRRLAFGRPRATWLLRLRVEPDANVSCSVLTERGSRI